MLDCPLPARLEFILVKIRPLFDESPRASREVSCEEFTTKRHPGAVTRVAGVEVRWIVISEEHQDGYPVEGADSGHIRNV
jgi:hypothetical protein